MYNMCLTPDVLLIQYSILVRLSLWHIKLILTYIIWRLINNKFFSRCIFSGPSEVLHLNLCMQESVVGSILQLNKFQ